MSLAKRKRAPARNPAAEKPPESLGRLAVRLASEPFSARRRMTDRWEPGFLRMTGLPPGRSLSYVVDALGIYYDATAPSELEAMLEQGGWETEELLLRAERGIAALRRCGLSLDTDPRRADLGALLADTLPPDRPVVVVVDQARDDPRVGFGLAGPGRFASMLAYAEAENPDATVVVVMDPGSPEGPEAGHLLSGPAQPAIHHIPQPVTASSCLGRARRVYTVSAHLGFEAVLAGLPTICFGAPFYAGWGFTDDRLALARRTCRRSPREVFAATYLLYSRYISPYDGEPITFEEALAVATLSAERERENAAATLCVGFASWKRSWIHAALGTGGFRPVITNRQRIMPADLHGVGRVVTWASRTPRGVAISSKRAKVPMLRMEDGFVRSIGLGVGLRAGASYVLDRTGIYYDASAPSDLETLLETATFDDALVERAARLRAAIVEGGISKYNVGEDRLPDMPGRDRPIVLVAGQVANDAAIMLGAPTVEGNLGLIEAARRAHPDAILAYKPHPDVEAGLRPGLVGEAELARLCDVVLRDVAAPRAIAAADRVEVMTSLLGFEALLRGKAVTTHGMPFYAGWGLTRDPGSPRRTRRLTLDELVAGALILYPRYLDPVTGLPCSPEHLVERLRTGDAGLNPRARTFEALLKQAWSAAFRRMQRKARGSRPQSG